MDSRSRSAVAVAVLLTLPPGTDSQSQALHVASPETCLDDVVRSLARCSAPARCAFLLEGVEEPMTLRHASPEPDLIRGRGGIVYMNNEVHTSIVRNPRARWFSLSINSSSPEEIMAEAVRQSGQEALRTVAGRRLQVLLVTGTELEGRQSWFLNASVEVAAPDSLTVSRALDLLEERHGMVRFPFGDVTHGRDAEHIDVSLMGAGTVTVRDLVAAVVERVAEPGDVYKVLPYPSDSPESPTGWFLWRESSRRERTGLP